MTQDKRDDNSDPKSGTAPADKPRRDAPNPAGPHAHPDLVDEDKTPGTGMLPDPGDNNPSPSG